MMTTRDGHTHTIPITNLLRSWVVVIAGSFDEQMPTLSERLAPSLQPRARPHPAKRSDRPLLPLLHHRPPAATTNAKTTRAPAHHPASPSPSSKQAPSKRYVAHPASPVPHATRCCPAAPRTTRTPPDRSQTRAPPTRPRNICRPPRCPSLPCTPTARADPSARPPCATASPAVSRCRAGPCACAARGAPHARRLPTGNTGRRPAVPSAFRRGTAVLLVSMSGGFIYFLQRTYERSPRRCWGCHLPTVITRIGPRTRTTLRCTGSDIKDRRRIPTAQSRHQADDPCSGNRAARPETPH